MKLQFVVDRNSGISYHRLVNPMEFIDWAENDDVEMLFRMEDEHKIDCDILYFSKFIALDKDQLLKLKDKGTKIIVDVDDSWDLPENHNFYHVWTERKMKERVLDAIEVADIVICATMRLQEKVRPYNKNTIVIPNALPFGMDVYLPSPQEKEKMGFIYVGGSNHVNDINLLEGKFKRIGTDPFIKNNAEFILAGYTEATITKYRTKEDYLAKNNNLVTVKIKGDYDRMAYVFSNTNSYRIIPSTNLDDYINFYDQADVSIVPLCNTEWNSYKSELKIIEAGCKGLPVICSHVYPYKELGDYPGVMWVKDPNDWIKHIRHCIKNPAYVKEAGLQLNEKVKMDYNLYKWNQTRMQVFKSLLK
jgi:processive 1,2-diacylglycerol beta-glucosyltransferase